MVQIISQYTSGLVFSLEERFFFPGIGRNWGEISAWENWQKMGRHKEKFPHVFILRYNFFS
jgi:hypothetical protein